MSEINTVQDKEVQELLDRLKKGETLTDEEINIVKFHQDKKEKEALDVIVKGINDVYRHTYKFSEYGNLELKVQIKAPNAIEQGKINAIRESFLNGTGSMVSTFTYVVFHTFALLQVCGIDVPEQLDPANVYNLNIVHRIGVDFAEWLDRFQY